METTRKAAKDAERAEAVKTLRGILKPGATVYCVLAHRARSGMQRRIDFYAIERGPYGLDLRYLTGYMGTALGYRHHKDGGLVVNGCGMDMGFHVVYSLGRTLWPKGTRKPHGTRNGEPDNSGGYALKSKWL